MINIEILIAHENAWRVEEMFAEGFKIVDNYNYNVDKRCFTIKTDKEGIMFLTLKFGKDISVAYL